MGENNKKISQNRQKKETLVAELAQKAKNSNSVIFANYQGLTHQQIETLKKGLKQAKAEFVVTKNTLLKLSVKDLGEAGDNEFKEPTAAIFVQDEPIAALKELAKTIKELKLPTLKFGIVDGQLLTGDDLIKLSSLPGKDVLLAQLVGSLKSPIFGLHRALSWNLQKLVMTLSAVAQAKPASPAPVEPQAPASEEPNEAPQAQEEQTSQEPAENEEPQEEVKTEESKEAAGEPAENAAQEETQATDEANKGGEDENGKTN